MNKFLKTFLIIIFISSINLSCSTNPQLLVAWHEAGHALAYIHNNDLGFVQHVTIQPDAATKTAGHVLSLQPAYISFDREQTDNEIIACLCGGVAEQLCMNQKSLTNSHDILQYFAHPRFASDMHQARKKALDMFTINSCTYYNKHQVQQKINETIIKLYYQAYQFLATRKHQLKTIADKLMQQGVLSSQESYDLIKTR